MELAGKLGTTGLILTLPAIFALAVLLSGTAETWYSKLASTAVVGACVGFYVSAVWVS